MRDTFTEAYMENSKRINQLMMKIKVKERFNYYSSLYDPHKNKIIFVPKMPKWKQIFYRFVLRKEIKEVKNLFMTSRHILNQQKLANKNAILAKKGSMSDLPSRPTPPQES